MVKTELELPESVEEFLSYNALYLVFPVAIRGGRFLKVSVELIPHYDRRGKPIPERPPHCPSCGRPV